MRSLSRVGRLFRKNAAVETVRTTAHFATPRAEVWRALMFYEEVGQKPSTLLRLFIPVPIRTDGDKAHVGGLVHCTYDRGSLEKRMTAIEPGHAIRFEVLEQRLGIEDCAEAIRGSYELSAEPGGTSVVLTTEYRGHLRPRWVFRPVERLLAHSLHRHILEGMRVALARGAGAPVPLIAT